MHWDHTAISSVGPVNYLNFTLAKSLNTWYNVGMGWPKIYNFRSESDPTATPYETRQFEDGAVVCDCRGFRHHNKCWHVTAVKEGRATNLEHLGNVPLSRRLAIRAAVAEGDDETAIETVLELFPSLTRDEAVDIVNEATTDFGESDAVDRTLPD